MLEGMSCSYSSLFKFIGIESFDIFFHENDDYHDNSWDEKSHSSIFLYLKSFVWRKYVL